MLGVLTSLAPVGNSFATIVWGIGMAMDTDVRLRKKLEEGQRLKGNGRKSKGGEERGRRRRKEK